MLGIFCSLKDEVNVILPYVIVAVRIREDKRSVITQTLLSNINKVGSLEEIDKIPISFLYDILYALRSVCFHRKRTEVRLEEKKFIDVYFRNIGKFEAEKYGVASAFFREVNFLSNLDEEVLVSSFSSKLNDFNNKVKYVADFTNHAELIIGFLFSTLRRQYYLNTYDKYMGMKVSMNKGVLSEIHTRYLKTIDIIPYFYNESLLVNYSYHNMRPLPKWSIDNGSIIK